MHKVIKIMGIVNVNDDSFYPASRASDADTFRRKVDGMLEDGADIIDIGAVSSRPGSTYIGMEKEWSRLSPVLNIIPRVYPSVRFSIDTFSSEIVRRALDTIGTFIVNDISAGEDDSDMLHLVGTEKLDYIAMHKRGLPSYMDTLAVYDDVTEVLIKYFKEFEIKATECGIDNWILDPGFGFAKNTEQSMALLSNLSKFKMFGKPILVGISRKRMTGGSIEETQRLQAIAVEKGASILRVHDVREAVLLFR